MVSLQGIDGPQCWGNSPAIPCKTINYPLEQGILHLSLTGAFHNITEYISIHDDNVKSKIYHVYCVDCNLRSATLAFTCKGGQMCQITLIGLLIKDSVITLSNVYIRFLNVSLEQVLIMDEASKSEGSDHLQIEINQSNLTCIQNPMCGLFLTQGNVMRLLFRRNLMIEFKLEIIATGLMLELSQTNFYGLYINIRCHSLEYLKIPAIVLLNNVMVNTFHPVTFQKYYIALDLSNPFISIKHCNFLHCHLEIQSKRIHRFEPVFFYLNIFQSSFQKGYSNGNGGALMVFSEVHNSHIEISLSYFEDNVAEENIHPSTGLGGGAYVEGSSIVLTVNDSVFRDNKATKSGSALFTSQGVILSVTNSTFLYDIRPHDLSIPTMLFAGGLISQFEGYCGVFHPNPGIQTGPIDLIHIGIGMKINCKVQCPKWYKHVKSYTLISTGQNSLQEIQYQCTPCSDNYYTPSGTIDTLMYGVIQNESVIEKIDLDKKAISCLQCPYGAQCTGNNVIPRPNYWGFWHEGELMFQQCPAGYCCSDSEEASCVKYNSCAGNRTGPLCGTCQEGFSISILTGKCTMNSNCGGDQWFWLFAIMVTMAYAIWYSFKDDIFMILIKPVKNIREFCSSRGGKQNITVASIQNVLKQPTDDNRLYSEGGDAGYFGIITYFVQISVAIKIEIEFSDVQNNKSVLDEIMDNMGKFLGLDIAQLSFSVCPVKDLTILGKHIYRFLFLITIYISWAFIYLSTLILFKLLQQNSKARALLSLSKNLYQLQSKLMIGMIEIIKYTYSGFCGIIFMSLACAKIGRKYVWWYDGTNVCLENWQVLIAVGAFLYALPFPIVLFVAMKHLKQNQISPATATSYFIFPIGGFQVILFTKIFRRDITIQNKNHMSDNSDAIISVLQGPYKEDERHKTIYWEAMISTKRILITAMALITNASIRMCFITALCIILFGHHIYVMPFRRHSSNCVEALSLLSLSFISVINLLKASLTDSGVVPFGPSVQFFKGLEVCERLFILIILVYILKIELFTKKK